MPGNVGSVSGKLGEPVRVPDRDVGAEHGFNGIEHTGVGDEAIYPVQKEMGFGEEAEPFARQQMLQGFFLFPHIAEK